MSMMKPQRAVGIAGYGAYVPRFRIKAEEIARVWKGQHDALPIKEKAVPGPDEDTATMSIEAARNALARAGIARTYCVQYGWARSRSPMP